jgi:hypothetical protein
VSKKQKWREAKIENSGDRQAERERETETDTEQREIDRQRDRGRRSKCVQVISSI